MAIPHQVELGPCRPMQSDRKSHTPVEVEVWGMAFMGNCISLAIYAKDSGLHFSRGILNETGLLFQVGVVLWITLSAIPR